MSQTYDMHEELAKRCVGKLDRIELRALSRIVKESARYRKALGVLGERAHCLAMGVLQSDCRQQFRGEVQDVLDLVDAYGKPRALEADSPTYSDRSE